MFKSNEKRKVPIVNNKNALSFFKFNNPCTDIKLFMDEKTGMNAIILKKNAPCKKVLPKTAEKVIF